MLKVLRPIKEQIIQIRDILFDLTDINEDFKTRSEPKFLATYEL